MTGIKSVKQLFVTLQRINGDSISFLTYTHAAVLVLGDTTHQCSRGLVPSREQTLHTNAVVDWCRVGKAL